MESTHNPSSEPSDPEHERLLAQLSELMRVTLRLEGEGSPTPDGWTPARVLAGGDPTGRRVIARGTGRRHRRAAQLAAEILGMRLAGTVGGSGLTMGSPHQERRLEFLYKTSQQVGELLDEQSICDLVVREAADLLGCGRASIMLLDPTTDSLTIRSSVGVPEDVAEATSVRPGERISGKVFVTGEQVLIQQGDLMPPESLGVQELRDSPSFLSVPLTVLDSYGTQRRVLGVINLTRKMGEDVFTEGDMRVVRTVAAHAAAQISNCRLFTSEQEHRRLAHELEIAAEIQLRLLPEKPLVIGPLRAAGICQPARRIGGDFFDYWQSRDCACLLVADVTGHDLAAALLAAALHSVMRAESTHRTSVAQMISRVNRTLYGDLMRAELQITLCYLEVDLAHNLLTYCCCGHPYPILLRPDRSVTWLRTGGTVIGIEEDLVWEEESVTLTPGDSVIVYTDGVVEAGAPQRKPFAAEGLLAAVREAAGLDVERLVRHVTDAVAQHLGESEPYDDITILAAQIGQAQ
jgi:sigma-B regulation protein RsbU (phosphoserine phosphatase)